MNLGGRPSDLILLGEASRIIDSALYAGCMGKWFNRFITIHFEKGRVRTKARKVLSHFLKHAGDWLDKRNAGPSCWIYTFENPAGDDRGGLHVHILIHVPYPLWTDFKSAERRWLKKGLKKNGGRYAKGVLVDEAVFFFAGFYKGRKPFECYLLYGLRNSLLYLLKGAEPNAPLLLGLSGEDVKRLRRRLRPSPQGPISGKRVGYSEALGPSRRVFPPLEIRSHPGMWMSGREARAKAMLEASGLEFSKPRIRRVSR